jgi:hypothetical protein
MRYISYNVLIFYMMIRYLEKNTYVIPYHLHSKQGLDYEGRLKGSWTGGSEPLLCREKQWLITSCNGGGNVVVAWSSSL